MADNFPGNRAPGRAASARAAGAVSATRPERRGALPVCRSRGPGRRLAVLAVAVAAAALVPAGPAAATTAVPPSAALHWGMYFGDNTPADTGKAITPATISLPAPVTQLSTSNSTQYALLANGQVWAWGQGTNGELGDGTDANSFTTPVQVQFPPGVQIAFLPADAQPYDSALAVDTTGQAWGWGLNLKGEFCNGTTTATDVPVPVPLPGLVTELAGANSHALYYAGGTLYACGGNAAGVAGTGLPGVKAYDTPAPVAGLPSGVAVTAVVSAFENAGALLANGDYYDWGYNAQGQLGNGTTTSKATAVPQLVSLPGPVTQVYQGGSAAGNGQTLVMLSSGAMYSWGAGTFGQLGTGSTANSDVPVPFSPPPGVTYTTLATGGSTSYAIDTSGNVWAWGDGTGGQLGNGTTKSSLTPVEVASGTALISSTAGDAAVASGS